MPRGKATQFEEFGDTSGIDNAGGEPGTWPWA